MGRVPGIPVQMGQQWVLGSPPNRVVQEQNILVRVASSAWVSSPITVSQVMSSNLLFRRSPRMPVGVQLEGVGGVEHVLLPSGGPMSWAPTGSPVSSKPQGMDSPGSPARFTDTV